MSRILRVMKKLPNTTRFDLLTGFYGCGPLYNRVNALLSSKSKPEFLRYIFCTILDW